MGQNIGQIALLVRDYEEAIAFYVGRLGFTMVDDVALGGGRRWVVVRPAGAVETGLLLARAEGTEQTAAIGRQAGGRVMLFLHTDDFWREHTAFVAHGVRFLETPRDEPYGWVAVFEDLYGNRWDLIERRSTMATQLGVQAP